MVGTKFDWLRHPQHFTPEAWRQFIAFVRRTKLKTGRAWALKEMLMTVSTRVRRSGTLRSWYAWAVRSRLENGDLFPSRGLYLYPISLTPRS